MIVASAGFIIRNKTTGDTLPTSSMLASEGKALTHVSLTKPFLSPPRLFPSQHSAEMTLRHWLRGKRVLDTNYPQADRHADEMEIVKVSVTLEWH